jgi:glycosyltransferase involved in cell wall biosynthesis
MSSFPLVSIIITSYNRALTIGKSIESSLDQDYPNLEIIICDNCSTDHSDQVIRSYLLDSRIKYHKNESNIGMLGNFEKSINDLAKGDYFVIVNSDDYLFDNQFVSDAINLVNKYKDVFIVKSKFKLLSEKTGKYINCKYQFEKEFYNGKDWFKESAGIEFPQIIDMLNWAGVMINRAEFMKLDIFKVNAYNIDIATGCLLLLKGNICFIDNYSYIFKFLINRVRYDEKNIENEYIELFNSIAYISGHQYNKIYHADVSQFYNRFYHYVATYYMHLTYRNNRKQYRCFKNYLSVHNNEVLEAITQTRHWLLYTMAHYNITFGKLISSLKSKIS